MLDAAKNCDEVGLEIAIQDPFTKCMYNSLSLSQCLLVSSTCTCHCVMSK